MNFSDFAHRMGSVLMEGSSVSAFVRTLFEAILPENCYGLIEKSHSSFKSYYSGKTEITALARRINAHTQTKLFEKFIKKSGETSIRKLCEVFSDVLPDINLSNTGKMLAELFDKIITEAAVANKRQKVQRHIDKTEEIKTTEKHQENNSAHSSLSEKDKRVIREFSTVYYQLIVTNEECMFDRHVITVPKYRAFRGIPTKLFRYFPPMDVGYENLLKKYPAIICRENTGYHGETDSTQMAIYGYIKHIVQSENVIRAAFKPLKLFPQQKLCDKNNAVYFDLNMEDAITSLNTSGWTIHEVNLFEAFEEAGMLDMPKPTPHGG